MLSISLQNKQMKVLQSMQNKSQLDHLEKIYASASSNTLNEKHKYLTDDTSFLPSSGTANRLTSKANSKSCFLYCAMVWYLAHLLWKYQKIKN